MSHNSLYGCNHLSWFFVLGNLLINFLLAWVEISVLIWSLYQIFHSRLNIPKKFITLFILTLCIFFCESIFISYSNYWLQLCRETAFEREHVQYSIIFTSFCMLTALVLEYLLFCWRFVNVFKGSLFELSNKLLAWFKGVTMTEILLCLISYASFAIFRFQSVTALSTAFALLYIIINYIIVIIIFIRKLNQLSKITQNHSLSPTQTKSNVLMQMKLVEMGTIVVVCATTALSSTMIILILIVLASMMDNAYYTISLAIAVHCDAMINSMVLVMQWPYGHKLYLLFCGKCHKCCQNHCVQILMENKDAHDAMKALQLELQLEKDARKQDNYNKNMKKSHKKSKDNDNLAIKNNNIYINKKKTNDTNKIGIMTTSTIPSGVQKKNSNVGTKNKNKNKHNNTQQNKDKRLKINIGIASSSVATDDGNDNNTDNETDKSSGRIHNQSVRMPTQTQTQTQTQTPSPIQTAIQTPTDLNQTSRLDTVGAVVSIDTSNGFQRGITAITIASGNPANSTPEAVTPGTVTPERGTTPRVCLTPTTPVVGSTIDTGSDVESAL